MSMRYKGGVISATPPTTSTTSASGSWTLQQQMQATAAGNWPRNGPFNYIEDVFSTWLYTGNGSTQTITNGIDLAGKGGLVWAKPRSVVANNTLYDTSRGISNALISNSTASQQDYSGNGVTSFNSNGFAVTDSGPYAINDTGTTYVSWTFREQPKFFDVVTYSGNSTFDRAISHNLGSAPGFVVIKRTDTTSNWIAQHRSNSQKNEKILYLNDTSAYANEGDSYFSRADCLTSTSVFVGNNAEVNATGGTYVMYLWAHNAGGFGTSGNDNVISCGSFTTNGSGAASVNLGYEPQWILCKPSSSTGDWFIADNMRGFSLTSTATLYPNSSGAENSLITFNASFPLNPTATGFETPNALLPSRTYIYIAIRRGPMAVPTTGTSVYNGITRTGTGSAATVTNIGFPPDMVLSERRLGPEGFMANRLAGFSNTAAQYLFTPYTSAEFAATTSTSGIMLDGTTTGTASLTSGSSNLNINGNAYIDYFMRRAPGFMDVCCYTGTGSARTVAHNLAAAPELMIVKPRSASGEWKVYSNAISIQAYLRLNLDEAFVNFGAPGPWNNTAPTNSVFSVSEAGWNTNDSGNTYVNYLFASCPGVSKVGSYTGTGTTQIINCGFTGGARFVMIKATSTTGNWLVWDSARGIVAGNDPYLALNSTAAEVTNTDWVDTAASGFELSNAGGNLANSNGVSYVFLAIS